MFSLNMKLFYYSAHVLSAEDVIGCLPCSPSVSSLSTGSPVVLIYTAVASQRKRAIYADLVEKWLSSHSRGWTFMLGN